MKIKRLLPIIFLFNFIFANIGNLQTRQGNIYPTTSASISMAEEKVNIRLTNDKNFVHAKFWMYNDSDETTGTVGFPYFKSIAFSKPPEIDKFWCKANGKEIKVEIKEINIEGVYDPISIKWFCWDNIFIDRDTTIIEVGYEGEWGTAYYGDLFFSYLIGTGKMWNGPIGKGEITFYHNDFLSTHFVKKCFLKSKLLSKKLFAQPIKYPSGINVRYQKNITIYQFENYRPKEDEKVEISFFNYYSDTCSVYEYFKHFECEDKTIDDIHDMKNEIIEKKGILLQLQDDIFGKYRKYGSNRLSDGELYLLDVLSKYEAILKSKSK